MIRAVFIDWCFAGSLFIESNERTSGVVSTHAVAGSLASERNHVRTVLPRSIDYWHDMEIYWISPIGLGKQTVRCTFCTSRYDMCSKYPLIFAERSYMEIYQISPLATHPRSWWELYGYMILRSINTRAFVVCLQRTLYMHVWRSLFLGAVFLNVLRKNIRQWMTQAMLHREPPSESGLHT